MMKIFDFISFNKAKGIVGAGIGLILFVLFAISGYSILGFGFLFVCTIIGFIEINPKYKKTENILFGCWLVFSIFFSVLIPFILASIFSLLYIESLIYFLNFLITISAISILIVLTGRVKLSIITFSLLSIVIMTINLLVVRFRGNGIKPSDFLFLQTAMNVIKGYSFEITVTLCIAYGVCALVLFVPFCLHKKEIKIKNIFVRLCLLLIPIISFFILESSYSSVPIKTFDLEGMSKNGGYLNFYLSIKQNAPLRLDKYSLETIDTLEKEYAVTENIKTDNLPDIVVVMNESFADFNVLSDINSKTNREVTPFFNSLQENTIKGYALSSVFGGGTANSEYEMLTGNTTAFLPYGSSAFQQYIHSDTFNLTSTLKKLGYFCEYTHPYLSNGWSRKVVIPLLQFEKNTFLEGYKNCKTIRGHISDDSVYDFILNQLDSKKNTPHFIFSLTMQNHGGYTSDNAGFHDSITLKGLSDKYPQAEQYLSLINESDRALGQFIQQLKNRNKDTVVLFFGDHFPNLDPNFYAELSGKSQSKLDDDMTLYRVPFFIWANFDIEEKTVPLTSLNYLSNYLLEVAKIPLSPYNAFLKDVEKNIPAINSLKYFSVSQNKFINKELATDTEKEWLEKYQILQYNAVFDSDNHSQVFFELAK